MNPRQIYVEKLHELNNSKKSTNSKDLVGSQKSIDLAILKKKIYAEENGNPEKLKFYYYSNLDYLEDSKDGEMYGKINVINKNLITLKSPTLFNDPYDCRLNPQDLLKLNKAARSEKFSTTKFRSNPDKDLSKVLKEVVPGYSNRNRAQRRGLKKQYTSGKQGKVYPEVRTREGALEIIERVKRNFHIACFATKLDSMYFWSHYAKSHQGFCIEYEMDKDSPIWQSIQLISYQNTLLNTKTGDSNVANMFVKHPDWEKELEWRCILNKEDFKIAEDKDISHFPNKNGKISAIYLGVDFDKKVKKDGEKEVEKDFLSRIDQAIPIYKMGLKDDSFNLFSTPFKRD